MDESRERQQVADEVAARLRDRGLQITETEDPEDLAAARLALADLLGLDSERADALLAEAAHRSTRLTSYYAQVSVINRRFEVDQRIRFVEHLWRVAYADGGLDQYEDHLVRKISNLLYIPHVQCMLARQRARGAA